MGRASSKCCWNRRLDQSRATRFVAICTRWVSPHSTLVRNSVGDTPIIGAGTYADNPSCAVSTTGHGEVFIRYAVAHDIAALMKYKGLSVGEAARRGLAQLPKETDGVGGVIALDARGTLAMEFDTEGMYRGWIDREGKVRVVLYKE